MKYAVKIYYKNGFVTIKRFNDMQQWKGFRVENKEYIRSYFFMG